MRWLFAKRRRLVASLCAVIVLFGASGAWLGVQAAQAKASDGAIEWMQFDVPYAALDQALDLVLEAYEHEISLDMATPLAYLAAKYWGEWGRYRRQDLEPLRAQVLAGEDTHALTKELEQYDYFYTCYDAVLAGIVGGYQIELPDENGDLVWQERFGLKRFFPIAEGYYYSHSDDFGNARSYGFRREHLGNDLMGSVGTPIVAIESGTVETLGWNQYGGWRIGIRSFDQHRYYYYAHLRSGTPYIEGLKEGQVVQAGTVIGYMGRTGYSTEEDVNNISQPHLHMGLQIIFDGQPRESDNELWIDIYALLDLLERNRSTVVRAEGETDYSRRYRLSDPDLPEADTTGGTQLPSNAP